MSDSVYGLGEHDLYNYNVKIVRENDNWLSNPAMSRNEMFAYLMRLALEELDLQGNNLPKIKELHVVRVSALDDIEAELS